MSEFLRYVLWELRRYFVLALLAGFFAGSVLLIVRYFYRRKYGWDVKFPWKRILLPLLFLGYLALVFFVTNFRVGHMRREANLHLFRAWREALNNFTQHRWLNVMLVSMCLWVFFDISVGAYTNIITHASTIVSIITAKMRLDKQ